MRKIGKKYVLLTVEELDNERSTNYKDGFEDGKLEYSERVEQLETALERKEKSLQKVQRKLSDAEEEIDVYQEERDKSRDVVKQAILNEDKEAALDARKESMDLREAKLKDRENLLNTEESSEYKKGYADGVADGVRKVTDITSVDRENMAKIAMVSAASHTKFPEKLGDALNVKGLASGTEN